MYTAAVRYHEDNAWHCSDVPGRQCMVKQWRTSKTMYVQQWCTKKTIYGTQQACSYYALLLLPPLLILTILSIWIQYVTWDYAKYIFFIILVGSRLTIEMLILIDSGICWNWKNSLQKTKQELLSSFWLHRLI